MMVSIEAAMVAAEERKAAALGDPGGGAYAPDKWERLAVFSGLDVDQDDLEEVAERAGYWFAHFAADTDIPLHNAMATCWVDAFLIGIMFRKLTQESDGDIQP